MSSLPARRVLPLPSASGRSSEGTPSRDLADADLTKYTHAETPRPEACFLCMYAKDPAHGCDPLEEPESNVINRMRAYWDENVQRMDFRYLAEDCARLFAKVKSERAFHRSETNAPLRSTQRAGCNRMETTGPLRTRA